MGTKKHGIWYDVLAVATITIVLMILVGVNVIGQIFEFSQTYVTTIAITTGILFIPLLFLMLHLFYKKPHK